MIKIPSIVKWILILSVLGLIGSGIKNLYEMHLDTVTNAVNSAKLEFKADKEQAVRERSEELRQEAESNRKIIQAELNKEKAKVNDLQRMLLIDHDLDRLLQRKPKLILSRVNKGTEEYFLELEVTTQ